MGSNLKNKFTLALIPAFIKKKLITPYESEIYYKDCILKAKQEEEPFINLSFSQEGEDLILYRLIGKKSNGFYVDIGAHHPFRFSNTYKFYKMGWRGINIDPLPESMNAFKDKRPEDINLEIAISNIEEERLKYFMFNEPAFNTLNENQAVSLITNNLEARIEKTIEVPNFKLSHVLNKYLSEQQNIDFMNIDVEGFDLNVIESNDWNKFRPNFLVIESFSTKLENDLNCEISIKLKSYSYALISKTVNSLIFKNEKDFLL